MDKFNFEKLDDNFINLYEEWIFIKAVEFSAVKLSELFDYKLTLWVEKKSHLLYFELGFPVSKVEEKIAYIVAEWYGVRFFPKQKAPVIHVWKKDFKKDEEGLTYKKQSMIKFS